MTTSLSDYSEINPIDYRDKSNGGRVLVPAGDVNVVVVETNIYLFELSKLFRELSFEIFIALGQRNISGFIGEVFTRFFSNKISGYITNPHADGRPDLLDMRSEEAIEHFSQSCMVQSNDGDLFPDRSSLAPFKYGGLEVKSTIGNPVTNYKKRLASELGENGFSIGLPRINYLNSITYWGHHTSCENLIGLYYDYCEDLNGVPQVMAVMHAELDPEVDWSPVSLGKPGSKKTSNTSLSGLGREKISKGVVIARNHSTNLDKFREIGLSL